MLGFSQNKVDHCVHEEGALESSFEKEEKKGGGLPSCLQKCSCVLRRLLKDAGIDHVVVDLDQKLHMHRG